MALTVSIFDSLLGGDGADTLIGGWADRMHGENGDDRWMVM